MLIVSCVCRDSDEESASMMKTVGIEGIKKYAHAHVCVCGCILLHLSTHTHHDTVSTATGDSTCAQSTFFQLLSLH